MQKEIANLKTVSEIFDIPLSTLRKWASERKFPGVVKLGRAVRVDIPTFRQWIQDHRIDGKARGTKSNFKTK